MQKKIIALAVAGLVSGAAFAQSNVTVYGVVDLGQAWVKSDARSGLADQNQVGRLDSNSSYVGFKGTEDLGNGMKAVFQIETGYSPDSGVGWGASRDSFVGLTGGFGTVVAGTLTHPVRAFGNKVELLPASAGIGTMASVTGTFGGIKTGADDRANNAIAYVSPTFSGFHVVGAYANSNVTDPAFGLGAAANGEIDPNGAGRGESYLYQVAAAYDNGPLFAGLAYHSAENIGGVSALDAEVWRLAAAYNFGGMFKVTFMYDNTDVNTVGDRNAWSLGGAYMAGPHTVGLQYAKADDIDHTNNTDADIWTLLYTYSMSKRTMIHARYSVLDNGSGATNNFYLNKVENPTVLTAGAEVSGFMVGLRHNF